MKQLLMILLFMTPYFVVGQEILRPADYFKKIGESEKPQLVDVRTPDEYKEGHIKDFINIDYFGSDFQNEIMELDKERPVFLYCGTGTRSEQTQAALSKMGYDSVTDLKGGFEAWKGAGYPLEK